LDEYKVHARAEQEAGKMTSEKQRAANRANAQHSTGPKTPEGKAAVRLNACWHGLFARDNILPGEDPDAFDDLWNQIRANLLPEGPIEEFYVDRVVNAMWRLRRLEQAEIALLHSRVHGLMADRLAKRVDTLEHPFKADFTTILDKAAHSEASEALRRAEDERDRDEFLIGRVIDADAKEGDAFTKLARYERSLERSLHHALNEFHHLRDKRRDRPRPPILDAITLNTEGTE
jgi:hypothetical protein